MSTPKRNCRWCKHSIQHDEDWFYCSERKFGMNGARMRAKRSCPYYEASWCTVDNMEDQSNAHIKEQEMALYKRRMAGDWS